MDTSEAARELAALRKTLTKQCRVCGTEFEAFGKALYCSRRCGMKADYDKHAEARRAAKRAAYKRRAEQRPSEAVTGEG